MVDYTDFEETERKNTSPTQREEVLCVCEKIKFLLKYATMNESFCSFEKPLG